MEGDRIKNEQPPNEIAKEFFTATINQLLKGKAEKHNANGFGFGI
jgi:hypothetical protein